MPAYNERLIAGIDEKYFNNLLYNPDRYKSLINERLGRFNPKYPHACSRVAQIDRLDNYIVKCLLENPSKLDRDSIRSYRDYLYGLFEKEPLTICESILFKHNVVGLLFTSEQLEKINAYKNSFTLEMKAIGKKMSNKEPITKEEQDRLLVFLISNMEHESPTFNVMKENMFGYLMQNPNGKDLLAKEFIFKFVASRVAKEENIPPVQVYISDDHLDGKSLTKRNMGCSYGNTSILMINRENVISDYSLYEGIHPLVKMMQTIAHETRHSKQAYEADNKITSFSSIEYIRYTLFRKYLSEKEYETNYNHSEIERDSNIYGWTYVIKLLEKFNPSLVQDINNAITLSVEFDYKATLGNKRNSHRSFIKDSYNVRYLDRIIKEHPEELQNYPQLLAIYNKDGSRKNIIDLIDAEEKTINDSKDLKLSEIFNEYYLNLLDSRGFDFDLKTIPLEEQNKIVLKTNDLLFTELKNIGKSISLLSKETLKEFNNASRHRLERVEKLLQFFNNNREIIEDLIVQDIKLDNKHALGFSLSMCTQEYNSVKSKIAKLQSLKNTKVYDELVKFSEGGYGSGPRL